MTGNQMLLYSAAFNRIQIRSADGAQGDVTAGTIIKQQRPHAPITGTVQRHAITDVLMAYGL